MVALTDVYQLWPVSASLLMSVEQCLLTNGCGMLRGRKRAGQEATTWSTLESRFSSKASNDLSSPGPFIVIVSIDWDNRRRSCSPRSGRSSVQRGHTAVKCFPQNTILTLASNVLEEKSVKKRERLEASALVHSQCLYVTCDQHCLLQS